MKEGEKPEHSKEFSLLIKKKCLFWDIAKYLIM